MQSSSPRIWPASAACLFLLLLIGHSWGCTVFDLSSAGFSANIWHLLPVLGLLADNGTFFVNSERFKYACSQGGGLHELFNTTVLQPCASF